jgi:hypothetical protein
MTQVKVLETAMAESRVENKTDKDDGVIIAFDEKLYNAADNAEKLYEENPVHNEIGVSDIRTDAMNNEAYGQIKKMFGDVDTSGFDDKIIEAAGLRVMELLNREMQ